MLSHCVTFCPIQRFSGLRSNAFSKLPSSPTFVLERKHVCCIFCSFNGKNGRPKPSQLKKGENGGEKRKMKFKHKENVWSMDNDLAEAELAKASKARDKKMIRNRRRVMRARNKIGAAILVSGPMLMEVENVLQTQEPVIRPAWNTFASSVSGIWKGVGAVFSPITAEMEPIDFGSKGEHLYDCYTLVRIETTSLISEKNASQIKQKINWRTFNPHGEVQQQNEGSSENDGEKKEIDPTLAKMNDVLVMPTFESFDFKDSDLLEEDIFGNDPGIVFFEDGSYSRGPVEIPVGSVDESVYYVSPTFKFEQCLVKGCHKRLRIVHTIEFSNGGTEIQIMRVAVYEEQWVSAVNVHDQSDPALDLKPFSQRKRTQPSDLMGSWKVFELSATPIHGEATQKNEETAYVYLCTETLKKRSLPETLVQFGEEEAADMRDAATILWLPAGVTAYVDVCKDGTLCIGVGWYSDEGIHLAMERDYGVDGRFKEARNKTEVKRRWSHDS